jgi:hypothetical protein
MQRVGKGDEEWRRADVAVSPSWVFSGRSSRSGWCRRRRATLLSLRSRDPSWAGVPFLPLWSDGPLRAHVTLLTLRSDRTHGADLTAVALGPMRSRVTLLTLSAWRALHAGLALVTTWPRQPLGARWPCRPFCAYRARLALENSDLLRELAHSELERLQAPRRRRLPGCAWFDGTYLFGLALRSSSSDGALGRAFCHSSLLRERGHRIRALRFTHQLRAPERQRPSGNHHSPQGRRSRAVNPAASIAAPQKVSPGSAFQPGTTLPRIRGQSQVGKDYAQ